MEGGGVGKKKVDVTGSILTDVLTRRGGFRILGKEGSDKCIHNWGRVRGGGGGGGGRAPSRDSKGLGERR